MIIDNCMNIKKITEQIREHGFAVVDGVNSLRDYLSFAEMLGDFVNQKDAEQGEPYVVVSEKNSINKLGFSHRSLFPHTDRSLLENPPDLVSLWCKHTAEEGGESLAVDMREVLRDIKLENNEQYERIMDLTATFSDERYSDFYPSRIFYQNGINTFVRFRNDDYIFLQPSMHDDFRRLVEAINKHTVSYPLKNDRVVIFNNKRMLHGRNKFQGHRELYRLHLNTPNNTVIGVV